MARAEITTMVVVFCVELLILLIVPAQVDACTVGTAGGGVTTDGRPVCGGSETRDSLLVCACPISYHR